MRFSPMGFSSTRSLPRWLALSVLAAPLTAYTQPELIADLSLSIAPPLPATIAPGASGMIQITLLNAGPDDAGFTSKVDNPLVVRTSLQMQRPDGGIDVRFFPPDPADECILIATVVDPPPRWASAMVIWRLLPAYCLRKFGDLSRPVHAGPARGGSTDSHHLARTHLH